VSCARCGLVLYLEGAGPEQLFPGVDGKAWREAMFQLCWQQHGGAAIAFADALDLSLEERDWFLERIGTQRAREANEIAGAFLDVLGRAVPAPVKGVLAETHHQVGKS
jgi:hypothetical protein